MFLTAIAPSEQTKILKIFLSPYKAEKDNGSAQAGRKIFFKRSKGRIICSSLGGG
jgi:hypothetical protein